MNTRKRNSHTTSMPGKCPEYGEVAPWLQIVVPQIQECGKQSIATTASLNLCRACAFSLLTTDDAQMLLVGAREATWPGSGSP